MILSQRILLYNHILQIKTFDAPDKSDTQFIVGKRFDKKYIYFVYQQEVENVNNFDNSFFEILPYEKLDKDISKNIVPDNTQENKNTNPMNVKFGDQILLKHVNSGKYLNVATQYTDSAKGSCKILLSDIKQQSSSVFQFIPTRTFEKISDPVKFESNIYIYNTQNQIYLNREQIIEDLKQNIDDADTVRNVLVGTHLKEIKWQLKFYSQYLKCENDIIRDKDLVYLVNSKGGGLLTIQKPPKADDLEEPSYIMKDVLASYPIKKEPKSFNCIWQISLNHRRHDEPDLTQASEINIKITHLIEQLCIHSHCTLAKLVYPQQIKSNTKEKNLNKIFSGEYIRIGVAGTDMERSLEGPSRRWLGEREKETIHKQTNRKYSNAQKKSTYTIKNLDFIENQGESVVFQIIKLPFDLKKQIYEFIEAKKRIQDFITKPTKVEAQNQTKQQSRLFRFNQAQDILSHISNTLIYQNCDQQQKEGNQNQSMILQKQMILNDIGFLDVIMGYLKSFYPNESNETEYLNLPNSSLFDKLHQILRLCCRNNRQIKYELSKKYIKNLLNLSYENNSEKNNYDDTSTLRQILADNKYAVQSVMTPAEVQKLLQQKLKQALTIQKYIKLVQVLRLLCKSSEQPIPSNQKIIIQSFLQNQQQNDNNNFKIRLKTSHKQQVLVWSNINSVSNWRNIQEIYNQSFKEDSSNTWKWFIEWIELVADACQGKNLYGKYFVQTIFSTKIIQYFVNIDQTTKIDLDDFNFTMIGSSSTKMKLYFHKHILRLINNAFIDTIYNRKINLDLIYYVKTKDYIAYLSLRKKEKKIVEGEFTKHIRKFLKKYIVLIQHTNLTKNHQTHQQDQITMNYITAMKNVFQLLKNMIYYELWEESNTTDQQRLQNQKQLICRLIKILNILQIKQSVDFKTPILQIINFYIDLDIQQYSMALIDQIERDLDYDLLNQQNNGYILKRISGQMYSELLTQVFQFLKSNQGKDQRFFILCMNTYSKLVQTRRLLYKNLTQTLILEANKEDVAIIEKLGKCRKYFQIFNIKGLKNISLENQFELDLPIWDSNNKCLIRYIVQLLMDMKQSNEDAERNDKMSILDMYKNLGQRDILISPYTECEKPNKRVQKMIKQMKIHRSLFEYIKQFTTEIQEPLSYKLLGIIYLALAVFAWKNQQNKKELSQLFNSILDHAQNNNGAIDVLKEYFAENEHLIYNQQKISKVTQTITNYIYNKIMSSQKKTIVEKRSTQLNLERKVSKLSYQISSENDPSDLYYAAKLLDFLRSLIMIKNRSLKTNKILVLSQILDKDRLKITKPDIISANLEVDKSELNEQIKRYIKSKYKRYTVEIDKKYEKSKDQSKEKEDIKQEKVQKVLKHYFIQLKQGKEITKSSNRQRDSQRRESQGYIYKDNSQMEIFELSPKLTYISVLFGLLAELVTDNPINIAQCKKLHSAETLASILKISRKCWPLKANTRHYINKLYYSDMQSQFYDIILTKQIETFIEDLNQYIYTRLNVKHLEKIRYRNSIRYTYFATYLYLNFEKTLESLRLIMSDEDFMKYVANDMGKNNENQSSYGMVVRFIRLYERLRYIKIIYFYDCAKVKKNIEDILTILEDKVFQFSFKEHRFINKNDKTFDYRQIYNKIKEYQQIHTTNKANDLQYDQLSLCSRVLSNTQLQPFFKDIKKYVRYAMAENDFTVLSFIDKVCQSDQLDVIDSRYNTKKSVIKIIEHFMNQSKIKSPHKLNRSFESCYQTYLNNIYLENYYNLNSINFQSNYINKIELNTDVKVFVIINQFIPKNFELFNSSNMTFYFRTLSKNLQYITKSQLYGSKEDNKNKNEETTLQELHKSFSWLIFKTVINCNLEEQIAVSFEFFKFASKYYTLINFEKSQEDLYNFISKDPKNQFLLKLDNFIVFLSNDIERNFADVKIDQKNLYKFDSHQSIFSTTQHYFAQQDGPKQLVLSQIIRNQQILQCFKYIFQFLQLLCENNYVNFKKEFRQQKTDTVNSSNNSTKLNNKNLLIRSTIELRKLFRMYNQQIRDLPEKILDFLNQIAQIPCYDNQLELSKSTFFEDVCQFIIDLEEKEIIYKINKLSEENNIESSEFVENQHYWVIFPNICLIIQKFLKIILSLLQSSLPDIYFSFMNKLDKQFFQRIIRILDRHEIFLKSQSFERKKSKNFRVQFIKKILIISEQLQTKMKNEKKKEKSYSEKNKLDGDQKESKRPQFIQKLEAKYKNDQCFKLKDTIQSIEVSLQTKEHKLYFFRPQQAPGNDEDNECLMHLEQNLNRSTQLQKLNSLLQSLEELELYMVYHSWLKKSNKSLIDKFMGISNSATLVSVLINVILILSTKINITHDKIHSQERSNYLILFQSLQFVLGTLYTISTITNEIFKQQLRKFNKKLQIKVIGFTPLDYKQIGSIMIKQASVIFYYLICIMGLFVSPYYYSMHIFYIFAKIDVLHNVYKAVIENFTQLVYLAMLGITFFLVFSILTLETYAPYADEQYCNSIFECLFVIYNKEVFIETTQANQPNLKSLSYEIIYSVFFGSLFGNIISGIMTDKFAQLRDKQNQIIQDQNNFCYICGRSRYEIEKEENKENIKLRDVFTAHKKKHNKWSYLFYIYELKNKQPTQYTGLQYIISEKFKTKSVIWFPIKPQKEKRIQITMQHLKDATDL